MPMMRNWSLRLMPIAGSVTHPAGQPIIQLLNSGLSRGFPLRFGSVGAGAGPTICFQRAIAGAYLPHWADMAGSRLTVVRKSIPPSPCWPAPKQSDERGVGSSLTSPGRVDWCPSLLYLPPPLPSWAFGVGSK